MGVKEYLSKKKKNVEKYFEKQKILKQEREEKKYQRLKMESDKARLELTKMKQQDKYQDTISKVKKEKFKRSPVGQLVGGLEGGFGGTTSKSGGDLFGFGGGTHNFDMDLGTSNLLGSSAPTRKSSKKRKRKTRKGSSKKGKGKSITIKLN